MAEVVPVPFSAPRTEATDLADRLITGDEAVFAELVRTWSPAMLRLARAFGHTPQAAEDVVQDTWLAVIAGLDRFQRRSGLRTWVFAILVDRAWTAAAEDARSVSWSRLGRGEHGPTVDPNRFQGADAPDPGHWTSVGAPLSWSGDPERTAVDGEIRALVESSLDGLPLRQRVAVVLRDVLGLDATETCDLLGVSPESQRVLLHRGRAGLRAALEEYHRA